MKTVLLCLILTGCGFTTTKSIIIDNIHQITGHGSSSITRIPDPCFRVMHHIEEQEYIACAHLAPDTDEVIFTVVEMIQ